MLGLRELVVMSVRLGSKGLFEPTGWSNHIILRGGLLYCWFGSYRWFNRNIKYLKFYFQGCYSPYYILYIKKTFQCFDFDNIFYLSPSPPFIHPLIHASFELLHHHSTHLILGIHLSHHAVLKQVEVEHLQHIQLVGHLFVDWCGAPDHILRGMKVKQRREVRIRQGEAQ